MPSMSEGATTATPRRTTVVAGIGLSVAGVLIAGAIAIPATTGWKVYVTFPPLHAQWSPHLGPGTVPAVALAFLAIRYGVDVAARVRWRTLLIGAFAAGLLWLASLALVDGPSGLGAILDSRHEYLRTARAITDVSALLHEFVSRIPIDAVDNWPAHVAGHPPGAVLFFWVLVQLGLGAWPAAGSAVVLLAATTPIAVLVTLRRLDAETSARAAAPFLVLGSAAIWMAVSADGVFTVFAAWGLCCLAVAATSRSRWAVAGSGLASGLLLGFCVFLSYGMLLLGLLALAVFLAARNWLPLPWALAGAVGVAGSFWFAGFAWWQAYPVLVERYWDGIASKRPGGYWVWGNLAALAFSAGPIVGAALATALARARRLLDPQRTDRVVVLLTLGATAAILLADLSMMSKAEVERIWLPFVPWLLVSVALLPERWRRYCLAGQLCFALLVQHLLSTGW
jgi:hypothetical protein